MKRVRVRVRQLLLKGPKWAQSLAEGLSWRWSGRDRRINRKFRNQSGQRYTMDSLYATKSAGSQGYSGAARSEPDRNNVLLGAHAYSRAIVQAEPVSLRS